MTPEEEKTANDSLVSRLESMLSSLVCEKCGGPILSRPTPTMDEIRALIYSSLKCIRSARVALGATEEELDEMEKEYAANWKEHVLNGPLR